MRGLASLFVAVELTGLSISVGIGQGVLIITIGVVHLIIVLGQIARTVVVGISRDTRGFAIHLHGLRTHPAIHLKYTGGFGVVSLLVGHVALAIVLTTVFN